MVYGHRFADLFLICLFKMTLDQVRHETEQSEAAVSDVTPAD